MPLWLLWLCLAWASTPAGLAPAGGAAAVAPAPAGSPASADRPDGTDALLAQLAHPPSPAARDAAARHLLAAVPADALARRLAEQPGLADAVLPALGATLSADDEPFADELGSYLAAAARARARQLARPGWSDADLASLLTLMVVDPARFAAEPAFRTRVLGGLPAILGADTPARLRAEALTALNHLPGFDFANGERLAVAWGEARQSSAGRRLDYASVAPQLRFSSDDDPIVASVYSLPSAYFDAGEGARLLAAVSALAPRRNLLVLTDWRLRRELGPRVSSLRASLLETWGRPYSPWPRDPFSFTHLADGSLVLLVRPNAQRSREEDLHLGPALVDALPAELDRAWGAGNSGVRWTQAPVPFHNGQVLLTQDAAWVSLHSLEPRVLALLGLDRVPVESFATADGIARYVAAARRAAAELEALYRRPVRFVHPLPEASATPAAATTMPASALMQRLGGGAGYDLDSLLTLLPGTWGKGPPPSGHRGQGPPPSGHRGQGPPPSGQWGKGPPPSGQSGKGLPLSGHRGQGPPLPGQQGQEPPLSGQPAPVALVASLAAGQRLLAASSAEDLATLRRGYGLAPPPEALRGALAATRQSSRQAGLEAFLDLVAEHLAAKGFQVHRLPLLAIPTGLLAGGKDLGYPEFLLTWNNVVVEARRGGPLRAEGFASLLPPGDAEARRVFTQTGCHLDLLPPLVFSILRNGGYRCASNQVREPPR